LIAVAAIIVFGLASIGIGRSVVQDRINKIDSDLVVIDDQVKSVLENVEILASEARLCEGVGGTALKILEEMKQLHLHLSAIQKKSDIL